MDYTNLVVQKLIIYAFLGGWVSGALGLGGGAIFQPVMLSMGVPPQVASATGMYIIMFTTFGSVVTGYISDTLNIPYALWISGWCMLGTIGGMKLLNVTIKKLGRQSPIVVILAIILGISAILIPYFGVSELLDKIKVNDPKIFTFGDFCNS